jgi:hypothetical protein
MMSFQNEIEDLKQSEDLQTAGKDCSLCITITGTNN